tara:strand:- start:10360 stop:11319 length:960 start_codon:yes stop_codon:yes gene_type:complete
MKKIVIITGDPNSINSELIVKSWNKLNQSIKKKIYLIGSYDLIKKQLKKLKYSIQLVKLDSFQDKIDHKKINIVNIDLKFKDPFKVSKKSAAKFVRKSLNMAHNLCQKKNIEGFINCPVNKNLLPNKAGVTEYLALKNNIKKNSEVMLIRNKNLSVVPITTHVKINKISKNIKYNLIKIKILTLNNWFKKHFKKKPRIGVLGLNPHNAEFSKDSEELKIILPAIRFLKKKGINLTGPLVADTLFINGYKKYDVIVGMYHDQVLAPFKTLYKFDAINITLGLNYLRASPDHGVATNIIKKFKANPTSLLKCINFFNKFKK